MKRQYELICMSFDGEYKREPWKFESVDKAWEYSNDLGSKWFFYPFHFVVKGKTIAAAPYQLEWLENKRLSTVVKLFNEASKHDDTQNIDVDGFVWFLANNRR